MKAYCGQGLRNFAAAALLLGVALGTAHAQQGTPAQEPGTPASQNAADAAETVVAVRIVTEDGRVLSEAPAGLGVAAGKPLDREQVAESIRALYRTGDYADARATSTPVAGGRSLDFVGREHLRFNPRVHRDFACAQLSGETGTPECASGGAARNLRREEQHDSGGAGGDRRAAGPDCGDGGENFHRRAEEAGPGVSGGSGRHGPAGRGQAEYSGATGARGIFRRGSGVRDEHQ